MAATFAEHLHCLVDEITCIPDPQERLTLLIDRVKRRPPLPESARTEANRVHGCVSAVWLQGEITDGICYFQTDADSPMVRALAALYQDLYNKLPVDEVLRGVNTVIHDIGLGERLSGTRIQGLAAMDLRFKQLALKASQGSGDASP
ncbi:MAG: SufE family protein [Verrucomicrobiota bacterium]|nr:SufE family protein [Verrucomicrobiota bacterium]